MIQTLLEDCLKNPADTAALKQLMTHARKDLVPGCFRSYDIRIHADYLPAHVVYYLGLKIGWYLSTHIYGAKKLTLGVGRSATHARPSSPLIHTYYCKALASLGFTVIDLGTTTTPDCYFASTYLKEKGVDVVVNISASHNPKHDNGIKHCLVEGNGFIQSLSASHMKHIKNLCGGESEDADAHDARLLEYLNTHARHGTVVPLFEKDHTLSHWHHLYICLFAVIGAEDMAKLNQYFKGDYKALLQNLLNAHTTPGEGFSQLRAMLDQGGTTLTQNLKHCGINNPDKVYKQTLLSDFVIVLDDGKGSTTLTPEIYTFLGAEVVHISPDRGYNPLEEKNQTPLKAKLKEVAAGHPGKEIIGIAHDEDGDRLAVMRSDGVMVDGDRLLLLASLGLANVSPKKHILVTEVKSRPEVRSEIARQGHIPLIVPTGFAFIKEAAINIEKWLDAGQSDTLEIWGETLHKDAVVPVSVWAELSGHFGLGQKVNYFFDDASLMAVYVLLIVKHYLDTGEYPKGQCLQKLDQRFPKYPSSGELNVFIKTADPHYIPTSEEKEALVATMQAAFKGNAYVTRVATIDGIQLFFNFSQTEDMEGWVLVRKSNNEDKLVIVTSGKDQGLLDKTETELFKVLKTVRTDIISGVVLEQKDSQGHERIPDPYVERRIQELVK